MLEVLSPAATTIDPLCFDDPVVIAMEPDVESERPVANDKLPDVVEPDWLWTTTWPEAVLARL